MVGFKSGSLASGLPVLEEDEQVRCVDDAIVGYIEQAGADLFQDAEEDTASVVHCGRCAVVQCLRVGAACKDSGTIDAGAVAVESGGSIVAGSIIRCGILIEVTSIDVGASEDVLVVADAVAVVVRAFILVLVTDAVAIAVVDAVAIAIEDRATVGA